ncbi:MAG: hypothetical protein ACM3WQ_03025 [Chloroflexota bacterium]
MNGKTVTLPCNIGDTVYLVEDFNEYYDKTPSYLTRDGKKVTIKEFVVDSFIVDENGIYIAEGGHDGYNKISTYHNLYISKHLNCRVFSSYKGALNFVKSLK